MNQLLMKATSALLARLPAAGLLLLILFVCVPTAPAADSNPPEKMAYQGYLVDGNGNPLGNTNTGPKNYDVVFRIYNDQSASAAANKLWAEQQTVTVDKGYFSVLLGEGSQPGSEPRPVLSTLFTNIDASDRYVEMTVKGVGAGSPPSDVTMLPRLRLLTSPYAFLARNSVNANNLVNVANRQVVSITSTNVGINKINPAAALDVNGTVAASGLTVNGPARLYSTLTVSGAVTVSNSITATGLVVSGSSTLSGTLKVGSAVTVSNNTVTATAFVGNGTIPLGGIIMWSGTNVPAGWALCDGSVTNGLTTPDLRGRFVLGSGSGTNLTPRTWKDKGGEETHTLTPQEMPAHTHAFGVRTVGYESSYNGASEATGAPYNSKNNGSQTFTPPDAGGGAAHNNMPPYYVLAFIMRVQ